MQVNPASRLYRIYQRHAHYYHSVLSQANQLYMQGGDEIRQGLALFDQEWSNIETGQAWVVSKTEQDEAASELCSRFAGAGGQILSLRQHPSERIRWLESAVTAAR